MLACLAACGRAAPTPPAATVSPPRAPAEWLEPPEESCEAEIDAAADDELPQPRPQDLWSEDADDDDAPFAPSDPLGTGG